MTTKALIVALALFAPVAAVSPGLMRREPDAADVAMIQKPKSKTGGSCDANSDSNCCFTAGAITQVNARHKSIELTVGQCAAGAMSIAGEEWGTLHKKMETCKTNVCQAQNVPVGEGGSCAVYTCPKGWTAKKNNVAKAPCPSAAECNFNCCDVDINADSVRKNGVLTYAALWAVANVTKFSNQIGFPVRHTSKDFDADMVVLNGSITGLYKVMNDISSAYKKACPSQKSEDDYSHLNSIRECVDMALCEMAKNQRTKEDLKVITMLREYYSRFEEVTWDYLWDNLRIVETIDSVDKDGIEHGNGEKSSFGNLDVDFMEAAELECAGLTGFMKELGAVTLLETEKAAAHAASKALIDAARATHALLNHHQDSDNSSMDATVAALHRAWEPACKLLNCDHTNYWDLLGASHSHSIALIESGASVNHMSVHVRTRVRLERRVQMFLSSNDGQKHGSKIYRIEGTRTEAQGAKYGAYLKQSLARVMTEHPKTYGLDHTLLSLADREAVQKFAKTPLQARILEGFQKNNLYIVKDEQQLSEVAEIQQTITMEDELDEEDEKHLESLIHRTLFWKAVGNFFKNVGKAVVSVVKAVGNGIIQVATSVGNAIAKAAVVVANGIATAAAHVVKAVVAVATTIANGIVEMGKAIGKGIVQGLTALGEAMITVVTAIGNAIAAFVDFIISLLACLGFGTCAKVGYGKKVPCPSCSMVGGSFCAIGPVCICPTTIGVFFGISISIGVDLLALLKGIVQFGIGIDIAVAVGLIPFWFRLGVGIAIGIFCYASCILEISVGVAAAAAMPLPYGSPRCVLGPCIFGGFMKCTASYGITFKLLCCKIDLITGCQSCGSGGCDSAGGESKPSGGQKEQVDSAVGSGKRGCVEIKKGNGAGYRGCASRSVSGRECQKWSSQYPHKWNPAVAWSKNNQNGLGDHEMCRNPNGHNTIWCLTKDPNKRWENCNTFEISELNYVKGSDRKVFAHAHGGTQPGHKLTMHYCWQNNNYPNCQWYFEESATRYGFYYVKGMDRASYMHAGGGTQHGHTSTMHQCWKGNDYPNCQWHFEPSTSRGGHWYLRGSDRFTFNHAHGGTQHGHTLTMHHCWKQNDYPNCQWHFSNFILKMYLAGYFDAIDRDGSVHASGGTQHGHWLTMHACHKGSNYPNCMWSMEQSDTRQGMYYLRGSDRETFAHGHGGTQPGHHLSMHYCWKQNNYPNCQWRIEGSQTRHGKYYFKGSDRASYLHASGGTQNGHWVTMHQCWKGNNYPNCQWTVTTLGS